MRSPLAVNTPAVTKDAVYVAFGNSDIARYSHDGKLAWVNRYMAEFGDPKMAWGYAVSPLVLDDSVLFPWNHHKGPCFLIGLDKGTGKLEWKKERPIGTAHATPVESSVLYYQGLLYALMDNGLFVCLDGKTGDEFYRERLGGACNSSPVASDGHIYLSDNCPGSA